MKKTIKRVSEEVLGFILLLGLSCIFPLCLLAGVAFSTDDPTEEISKESYLDLQRRIDVVDTVGLDQTKKMLVEALSDSGYQVDSSILKVWSDSGLTTMSLFWKSGDQFFKTDIRNSNGTYPFYPACYVLGGYGVKLKDAEYGESGYLYIDSEVTEVA